MDLRTELEDGTKCNVEIQLLKRDFEIERFLYYWSNAYSRQLARGEKYNKLCKTISIIILDHEIEELKGMDKLDLKWQIRDNIDGKRLLTDQLELCIIEIPKAKRLYAKMKDNKICQWMWFFDEPQSEEVSKIMNENSDIQDAVEELDQVSQDERTRRIAELREKAIRDEHALKSRAIREGLEEGKKQGLQQGLEQGVEQGKKEAVVELVKRMLSKEMDLKEIQEISGLTEQEINEIKTKT